MKKWLRREAVSGSSQVLHNHSIWMMPNVYPGNAILNTSCKLVISPRGTMSDWTWQHSATVKQIFWHLFQKKTLQRASAFVASASSEYEDIRRRGFKQPVAILPNGIDIPNALGKSVSNPKTLLFISRIHPKKGIENLLRAWAVIQFQHTDWNIIIAGPDNGGHLEKMKTLAQGLGLKRCTFPGPLYGDDKLKAFQNASLYVLPTHSENFGMTVAEALVVGTPAIVTKGAPWEGLNKENAGWWIDTGVEPLVAVLKEALSCSPEHLNTMGQRGREWVIRDYSWDKIGVDMARFYDWLVNGGSIPPFVKVD
jgi:glycosyltransferase involved in cell wall biosynthesis